MKHARSTSAPPLTGYSNSRMLAVATQATPLPARAPSPTCKPRSQRCGMWDAAVHDLAIHPRPKGKRQGGAGNSTRVDGHETEVYFEANAATDGELFTLDPATGAIARGASARNAHSAFDIFLEHDHSVEELRDVFEAAMSSNPQGTMTREKICFRCFGIGHTENEDSRAGTKGCSLPKRSPGRDIAAYLLLISALAARQGAGGRRIPTDAMPSPSANAAAGDRPRRRSPEPKPRGRAGWWRKTTQAARSAEEDETEEDGGEASADALTIAHPADALTIAHPPSGKRGSRCGFLLRGG